MAPNSISQPGAVPEEKVMDHHEHVKEQVTQKPYRRVIVWRNVILFAYLHMAALYGFYLMLTSAKIFTTLWAIFMYQLGGLGITAGAHRLWSHKAYKAKWPLRLLLAVFNLISFQNDIFEWARDHRVHHKYTDTNADPHNATRGFFFSHVGWLLCKKHPDVMEKGKGIDLSDLRNDPIVMFQRKHYLKLMPLFCFVIPTAVPMYFWGENFVNAWFVATMSRYTVTLNATWLVNSAAHFWGSKPYDVTIRPSENIGVSIAAFGEGFHNYHHVFPWDYKTAELGDYLFNPTTAFIDFFAKIGWAYDLKTVPKDIVMKRAQRTGKGSTVKDAAAHSHEGDVWGWEDKDLKEEDKQETLIINYKQE